MAGLRHRARRGERGAALIEAAIVTPVFLALIFGIFEFGLLYRDRLTTDNAAHQGVRAVSVSGRSPSADYLMLRSVEHGLAAMDLDRLDYVVVFRASGPDDTVPPACLTASQVDTGPGTVACNRYVPSDFALDLDDAGGNDTGNFRCGSGSVDRYWCPTYRQTSLAGGLDYVGLHIQTRHDFITGLFGGGRTLSETTILRMEPQTS